MEKLREGVHNTMHDHANGFLWDEKPRELIDPASARRLGLPAGTTAIADRDFQRAFLIIWLGCVGVWHVPPGCSRFRVSCGSP